MLRIGVDIDDTISLTSRKKVSEGWREYYSRLKPNKQLVEKLRVFKKAGHQIILFTSRYLDDHSVTMEWLKRHQVPYHHVIFNKPRFDLYIDNDAVGELVTPEHIEQLNYLKNRKPWEIPDEKETDNV